MIGAIPKSAEVMVDSIDFELSAIVRFGVSEKFSALLQGVELSTMTDLSPRYGEKAIYELRRNILCHNYSKSIFELAHLLIAVTHAGPGFDELFWVDEAITTDRFKQHVTGWQSSDSLQIVTDGRLELVFGGNRRFAFHYHRINLMAAWSELLLFLIPSFKKRLQRFEGQFTIGDVDDLIKTLQADFVEYLCSNVQSQTKFREGVYWLSWLRDENTDVTAADGLNDQRVLHFWHANWQVTEFDYRKFSSVVESACSFLAMIQQAKQGWQIDHAASLNQLNGDGSEWLSGISGEDLALMQQLDEADVELPKGNIERLNAPGLSDIKFLTGKDARLASQFGQDPVLFELLPLSRIRLNLFGRHQAKIIGDLQNHNGAHISGLVNCDLVEKPGDWLDSVRELMSRVSQTRLACAHVLIQHNQSEALEILAEVLPENSRPAYRLIVDDELREYLYDQTTEWRKECEAAFRKNQRAGFKLLPGLDRAGDYAIGDGCLKQIQSQYERIKKHVVTYGQKTTDEKLEPCLSRFESDKVIFSRVFGEIYDSRVTLKKFQKQVV